MSTATSSAKFPSILAAIVLALALPDAGAAAGPAMPDTENGRYTLSTNARWRPSGSIPGPARFRPAAIQAAGWACYAVPDERAALDAEIGPLQVDNEKLKAELASPEPTCPARSTNRCRKPTR